MNNYKIYLNGIDTNSLKTLSSSETLELIDSYKKGNLEAKELLVNGNLKLVLSIVNKYNNGKNDANDLFQIGCIGLIKAIDNFDSSYGVMFSTYAVPLILGEVKRYIRDSSSVRVSRGVRDLAYKILRYKDLFLSVNGYEASNEDIIRELNINELELAYAMDSLKSTVSIYEPIYNDGGDTIYLIDQIGNPEKDIDKDDLIALKKALLKIKPREKEILINRYIIGKTQMEIADELGVSQAQISRIEKNAINNIKKLIL